MLFLRGGFAFEHFLRLGSVMCDAFLVRLDGRVDVVIGEVEQVRFVGIAFLKEFYGLLGESLGKVLALFIGFQRGIRPRCVIATRRRAAVVPADVDVKTLILRPMPFTTQMPFAGEESLVSMLLQLLGNRHLLVREVVAILRMQQLVGGAIALPGDPVGDIHPHRVPTGHDARACGAANRTGRVALREPHAGSGEPINVRCLNHLLPVTTKVAVSKVICHDVDDIGTLLNFRFAHITTPAVQKQQG